MSMDKETRAQWVARGCPDPVVAYRGHAVGAARRGIDFKLTFAEWWALWEPFYDQRGRRVGQYVMCRRGDAGAYEVGNVRIDTGAANAKEWSEVYRARNLRAGRLPIAKERQPLAYQAPDDWLTRRKWVFEPYGEDEEEM